MAIFTCIITQNKIGKTWENNTCNVFYSTIARI